MTRRLGILLFPEVEVLDVAGPFEVFSLTGLGQDPKPFEVLTLGETRSIKARNGLGFEADFTLQDCPPLDILLIPGGPGSRKEIHNPKIIDWIVQRYPKLEHLLTVCTGALLLAKSKIAQNLEWTTHHLAMDELRALIPQEKISEQLRWVDNGKIILSGGISAGIDMSLYVVSKLLGEESARQTAEQMEYFWNSNPSTS